MLCYVMLFEHFAGARVRLRHSVVTRCVVSVHAACRAVSEVSSFFNIPLISWVATDPDFDDKIAYSTLSRTLGPFSKLADFLLEHFLQYNWRRIVVVVGD